MKPKSKVEAKPSDFSKGLSLLIGGPSSLEGTGFVNHPLDLGGPTYFGISQGFYDEYCRRAGMASKGVATLQLAEIQHLYLQSFWNLPQDSDGKPITSLLPFPANVVLFQLNVNVGEARATKLLQATLGTLPDGSFGPESRLAISQFKGDLGMQLLVAQLAHYVGVEEDWDANGLFNRVQKVKTWLITVCPSNVAPAGPKSPLPNTTPASVGSLSQGAKKPPGSGMPGLKNTPTTA